MQGFFDDNYGRMLWDRCDQVHIAATRESIGPQPGTVAYEEKQREKSRAFRERIRREQEAARGKIPFGIGSSKATVLAKFGKPYDINRTVNKWGVHEQWVYGSSYIYFDNDIVTAFQD